MRNKKIAAIFMIAVLLVSVFVFVGCEDPAVKVIYKDINPKYETDDSVEEYITVGEAEIKPDMILLELSKDVRDGYTNPTYRDELRAKFVRERLATLVIDS